MIGIELTANRIRVADVRGKGSDARISASFTETFPTELVPAKGDDLGKWLKTKLRAAGIGSGDAVVLLGRGIASLKTIRVPVVPDNELPQVVSFAVEGNTSQVGETIVDYQSGPIHTGASPETGDELEVFTAVAGVETIEAIKKMLAKAGLNPKRLGVRAYGVRALLPPTLKSSACDIVLYAAEDSIEVSVWMGVQLRLCRSIAIVGGAVSPSRCVNEIRRTLASFHSQSEEGDVTSITFLGRDTAQVAEETRNTTALTIHDSPFPELDADFLAIVGGTSAADDKATWPIDFLRPKKAAPQSDQKRTMALVGALVAVIVGGGGFFLFNRELSRREREIKSLSAEVAQLTAEINEYKPTTERHEVIKQWVNSGDGLLDELQEVAAALPDTSDMILTGLEYNAGQNDQPGTIKLDGLSRDQRIVTQAQTQFASTSDKRYEVVPRGMDPGSDVGAFVWRFGLDLMIDPLSMAQYAARSESRTKAIEKLAPPVDMVRKEMPLAHQAPASASTDKKVAAKGGKGEKNEGTSAEAKPEDGETVIDKKIKELLKLTPEQREVEISKEKKFQQNMLRKAIKRASK